jgi:hypothetical protein
MDITKKELSQKAYDIFVRGIGLNFLLHTAERFFTSWKDDVKVGE